MKPFDQTLLVLSTVACCLTTLGCHTATRSASVDPVTNVTPSSAMDAEKPSAAPAVEKPAAKTYDNTIKWSTASEVDNFGFDVFRGDGPDGPFERLNAETIEGAGTVDEPTNYRFVDDTIDPHRTYYYYVESISMNGVRERFTPVGKAGPKIKPKSEEAETEDGDKS